jgi:thiosulfate reductase cytochrome b subunit
VNSKPGLQSPNNWIYRHSYNVRICHWVNVLSCGYLLASGIMIFLQFPELYWGKVGFQGYDAVFKLSDWGLSWEEADALGNRLWGRNYHFLFAWIFLINGLIYLTWNLWKKSFYQKMLPRREELGFNNLKTELASHLRLCAPRGEAARNYNVLQKISYLVVIFILFPFMLVSGFAQMPAFTAISPELIDLFGGRQTARTLHVVCTLLLVLFVIVHLVEICVAGAVNKIRSMITGSYALPAEEDK